MTPLQFEAAHGATWSELEAALGPAPKGKRRQPSDRARIASLYRAACEHLALAEARAYPVWLIERLEALTARGHQRIYGETAVLGEGLSSRVVLKGRPLVIEDLTTQFEEYGGQSVAGTRTSRAWMGAPLLAGEEVIGLLSVQSFEPGVYTPVHLQFLSTLAHHAAVAIQNARLFAEIRGFNDRLERLVA